MKYFLVTCYKLQVTFPLGEFMPIIETNSIFKPKVQIQYVFKIPFNIQFYFKFIHRETGKVTII